jgi:predicted SAM-dependent methyltransferase
MAAERFPVRGVTRKDMAKGDCVQFGCGLSCPDGWLNFDSSPRLRLQKMPILGPWIPTGPFGRFPEGVRVGDIVTGLPIEDQSVRLLYCSHVLEHLSLTDLRQALANCHRVLADEGVFRLVLPDLEFLITEYVSSTSSVRAETFIRGTLMGTEKRNRRLGGLLEAYLGNSRHLWLWDYSGLTRELAAAGFQEARRATQGDSHHPEFSAVEAPDRWSNALGIEARK